MDLLGDIGTEDQLTSARTENAVLTKKVKELSEKVKELTLENQCLKAEVEMYRKETALPNFSNLALGKSEDDKMDTEDHHHDDFVTCGNGVFCSEMAVTLDNLHGSSNLLCCALNANDTLLCTGGADNHLNVCAWGAALGPSGNVSSTRIPCTAPVICTGFSSSENAVAGGCMDGSIHVASLANGSVQTKLETSHLKHGKYVKTLAWCPTAPILATASADGHVTLSSLENGERMDVKQTLHLPGTVECLCFSKDGKLLYCYTRGTPYLSVFDLDNQCQQTKLNLNKGGVNGGLEDHVSFTVMDMAISPKDGKYLALATDTSRNIVIDAASGNQVRNLYGHTNDGYSQPKIGWSANGQYLYGNAQEESVVCVWDIASSKICKKLDGHSQSIRALYSSPHSDTLVTTSFDRSTKVWLAPSM